MREAIREVKDQRARLLRHLGVRKLELWEDVASVTKLKLILIVAIT